MTKLKTKPKPKPNAAGAPVPAGVTMKDGAPAVTTTPGHLRAVSGSAHDDFGFWLMKGALGNRWRPKWLAGEDDRQQVAAMIQALRGFAPRDEVEGMMAAQAISAHAASMECHRRAMLPDQPGEAAAQYRKQAANLSRTFMELVAALDRRHGKGVQQVVRVERVMVAPGGQAIVGNVQAGAMAGGGKQGEGEGDERQTEGEPHAPPARLAHDAAPGTVLPQMRGTDARRDALPVPSDGQRTVPDARGA